MPGAELLALLLAALPAAAPAAARVAPRPCTLAVTADRARVEATDPRTLRVTVAAPVAPRLTVSAGEASSPVADGPGRWAATWTVPPAGIPQIGFIAALAGDDCGLLAVPLFGSGDAVVRTRPRAEVEVRIGERTFGPATAGADGVALIPVEVPPGVDFVLHGTRRISLDIPPQPHAVLVPWLAEAPSDLPRVVPLLLAAVAADGAPHQGAPPALTATAGTLGAPEPAGPGLWRLDWRLPPGPVGQAMARARLPGEPAAELTLPRPAGAPASAVLRLERSATSPDEAPVGLAVALADAAGHPADGEVTLSAAAGLLSPVRHLGAGSYAATWTPPEKLEGRAAVALAARAAAAEATASVALRPGEAVRLLLTAPAEVVTADGQGSLPILAELSDRHGNPVDRPLTGAAAVAGDLGPARPDGPGRFRLDYRPRRAAAWTTDEVTAESTPLTGRLPLRLRPPTARFTVGAWAGAALQGGSWLGLQAGAEATAWRWLGGQELGAGLSVDFSRFGDERTAAGGTVPFTGELRTLTALAVVGWRRAAGRRVAVGAEVGAGAGRVESLVGSGGALLPEATWRPALGAGAWIGLPAWRGRAVVALRGRWLAAPHLATLQGTVAPLSLSLGYELDVP